MQKKNVYIINYTFYRNNIQNLPSPVVIIQGENILRSDVKQLKYDLAMTQI